MADQPENFQSRVKMQVILELVHELVDSRRAARDRKLVIVAPGLPWNARCLDVLSTHQTTKREQPYQVSEMKRKSNA